MRPALLAARRRTQTYDAAVTADAPLSWYRMADAGTTMADAVGGRSGVWAGSPASIAALRPGATAAKRLDGVNDRGDVTTGAFSFTGLVPFSVELVMRTPGNFAASYPLLAYTGTWELDCGGGSTNLWLTRGGATAAVTLTVNTVHHLAWTFDGATLTAYRDGVQAAQVASTASLGTSTALTVGSAPWGAQWLAADLSDLAIYNKALSAARVAAHAAALPL